MKRSVLIMLLFSLLAPYSKGQLLWKMRRYEAVAGFGPTLFFGDIGGFSKSKNILGLRDMSFLQTRFDLNFNVRYRITQDINVRLSFAYGFLHATEKEGQTKQEVMKQLSRSSNLLL